MKDQEENGQSNNGNGGRETQHQTNNSHQEDVLNQGKSGSDQSGDQAIDHNSSDEHMQIDEEGVAIDPDDQA